VTRAWRNTFAWRRRASTLAEVIIALVITGMVGMSVAAILQAASYGTSSRREVRRLTVRRQQVEARLNSNLRNAAAVLASGAGSMVLWTGDANGDTHVNFSELCLIELPGGSSTLSMWATRFPENWNQVQRDAADTAYAVNADFAATAQTAKSNVYFVETPWTQGASELEIALQPSTPQAAVLVSWRLTLTDELLSEPLIGAAALAVHVTPE